MGRILGEIIFLVWWVLFGLPPRLLGSLALLWLNLLLWLHRRRRSRSGITGAEAATIILSGRGLKTRVRQERGRLVDRYVPRTDTVVLSERVYRGVNIGGLSIAAHEAGHAIQARRWFVPWLLTRLLAPLAGMAMVLCLWAWLIGLTLANRHVLLFAGGCFGIYILFLLFELICEIDASRRAVRELLRHGILSRAESRIARRILRAAVGTYLAAFGGSTLVLASFLIGVGKLCDQAPTMLEWLRIGPS